MDEQQHTLMVGTRAAATIADDQDSMGSVEVVVKCLKKDDSECGVQTWARKEVKEARGTRLKD